MFSAAAERRPTLPTISVTRPPVVNYWTGYAPAVSSGLELDGLLPPLDGHLLYLFHEVSAEGTTVVDLAAEATAGTSTVVLLRKPTTRVYAAVGTATGTGSILAALRAYERDHAHRANAFETLADVVPPASVVVAHAGLLLIVDARAGHAAETVDRWLKARPDAIALVLGVGLVGASESLEALVQKFGLSSGRKLWLARELAESLSSSGLAIVANASNAAANTAITRVAGFYRGNVSFIDLLWNMNREAIAKAGADRTALEQHGNAAPLIHELASLKRELALLNSEASLEKLAELTNKLARQEQTLQQIQSSFGFRLYARLRRWRARIVPDNCVLHRLWLFWRRHGTVALLMRPFGRRPA